MFIQGQGQVTLISRYRSASATSANVFAADNRHMGGHPKLAITTEARLQFTTCTILTRLSYPTPRSSSLSSATTSTSKWPSLALLQSRRCPDSSSHGSAGLRRSPHLDLPQPNPLPLYKHEQTKEQCPHSIPISRPGNTTMARHRR